MRGQKAFLNVRVFVPKASRYLNKALLQCYIQNEKEKKQQKNERVLEIDHGSLRSTYVARFMTDYEEDGRKTRITSINCHKWYMNKNIFRVIEIGATIKVTR